MAIKNDYLLDMIARFVQSVVDALGKARGGLSREAVASFESVVGDVLDMDASCALALSPASLVTMMQLSAVDESLAVYAVYALGQAASVYEDAGDATAGLRRAQAQAIADAYGFPVGEVPAEVADALDGQDANA